MAFLLEGEYDPDGLAQTLTYNSDGTVATIVVHTDAHTYTQTFTYTAGQVSGISAWVRT